MIKNKLPLLFFILAVVIIVPRFFYMPPDGNTVDDGRNFALAYFTDHRADYAWGKDVIYTYGPLGVLSTRWFPASYIPAQIVLDLYVVFCLVLAFVWIKRLGTKAELYMLCLSVIVSMWEINILLQLLNIIFLILIYRDKLASVLSVFIVISSVFLMYVKLNTLIVTIPILVLLSVLLVKNKMFWVCFGLFFLFIQFNIILIYGLNVSPIEYIRTAIDTVSDHAYAMYMWNKSSESPFHVSVFFSIVVGVSLLYVIWNDSKPIKLLLLGTIALFYFVLFKEGFVRADMGHYMQYFRLLPLTFFCIYLLTTARKKVFAGAIVVLSLFVLTDGYNEGTPLFSGETPVVTYIQQIFWHDAFVSDDGYQGKGSIDYLNNSCLNAMYNTNKNWHSRPAFQSMVAISPRIDSINAAYYLSPMAPDTVFYDSKSLDDLNPLWDDPQLKQVILRRYKFFVDRRRQTVFIKNRLPLIERDSLLMDTAITFDDVLDLPRGTTYMKAEVKYTWEGRLRAILWQPPHITANGFRYISPLHNNQFLILNSKNLTFRTDMEDGVEDSIRVKFYSIKYD